MSFGVTDTCLRGINKTCAVLCLSLGFLACLRHGAGIDIPLPVLSLLSVSVVLTAWSREVVVNRPLLALVVVLGAGLILHPFPETMLRSGRFLAFVIGLIGFSPLLVSGKLCRCRDMIAGSIYVTMSVMVSVSFLVWISCLAVVGNDAILFTWFHHYGFRGVFRMGMTLSPISATVAIIALSRLIDSGSRRQAVVSACLFSVGVVMCLAGGSRIALAGLCVSLVAFAILKRHALKGLFKRKAAKVAALCMLSLIAISMPSALSVIAYKSRVAENHGSLIYSRLTLWENRMEEFRSSPVIGIGYANEFPSPQNGGGDLHKLEPGSSWLSLLSYGGVIGAGTFLVFLILLTRRLLRNRSDRRFPLCASLLLFFLINGISEGWLLFAGSLISPLFWLTTSRIWEMGGNMDSPDGSIRHGCYDHEEKSS